MSQKPDKEYSLFAVAVDLFTGMVISELNKERIAQVYFGAGTVINMFKKDSQQERFCVRYVLTF
ncbi:MAG: hypothetical protein IAC87_00625 [Muribaculum sp.]|uniref:Uncharacterized protein n=1 Tax=Candidatus Merdivivens faecigallinarum TaxID=2840871 RepID=A0A9D9NPH9_9BACT|nr:hypothetical protein [Candidatus Merdivivens faecigallinarum]